MNHSSNQNHIHHSKMAPPAVSNTQKPHVVCVPYPSQGHFNPMLKLAKLLHSKGFHITFINTIQTQNHLLKTNGPNSLDGLPSFRFESIPKTDATQDIPTQCESIMKHFLAPFKEVLEKINARDDVPKVSCIVSDGCMSFTVDAAKELGVPQVMFWTISACGFLAYLHYYLFVEKGLVPFKDESYLTKEHLDTPIDWIPSMNLKLKDIPTFIRTTNPNDFMLNFLIHEANRVKEASAIILNTFDALEHDVLKSIQSIITPPVYSIGPIHQLVKQEIDEDSEIGQMRLDFWREETECLDWLNAKDRNSVVYVNFGRLTELSATQVTEFAWGLAATGKDFLWVIRPDLVPSDLLTETTDHDRSKGHKPWTNPATDRIMFSSWCPQEKVLSHPSVGGFLTHCGWNSMLESLSSGVPMVCWPFFAEQQTNCKFCCDEWEVGIEIGGGGDVKREEVEAVVRELMDGEKGKKMREKAEEWQRAAEQATAHDGSSVLNLEMLVILDKSQHV